jgi:type IV pilus assembly protein PilF
VTAVKETSLSTTVARRWAGAALALGLLLGAGGCAAPASRPPAGDGQDMRTASDQTDNDRRARVRLELASAYFGRGQTETALDEIKQALIVKPDSSEAYNLRGLIYAQLDNQRLAEESFQRALQLNARDADAMHNYGWYLCQQGRFDEADRQFVAAIGVPQYRDVVRSLMTQGVCQARAGKLEDAERTLLKSFELDPASPATAVNLSEVLYQRRDYERARFYIRRVNAQPNLANAQTLWLAARIEHRLGNRALADDLGRQLRNRFPQAPEALAFERRRFDE